MKGLISTMVGLLLISSALPGLGPQVAAMPPETIVIHYDRAVINQDTGLHYAEVTYPSDCQLYVDGDSTVTVTSETGGVTANMVEFPGETPPPITVVCQGRNRCEDIDVTLKHVVADAKGTTTASSTCGWGRMAGPISMSGVGTDTASSPGQAAGPWSCRAEVTGGEPPHWFDVKCKNMPHVKADAADVRLPGEGGGEV